MKAGLTTSVILHAAVLGFGLLTLSAPAPLEVADVEALPVDIVPIEEITQIQQGEKTAKPAEKAAPKPTERPDIVPEATKVGEAMVDSDTAPTPEPKPTEVKTAAVPPPSPKPTEKPTPKQVDAPKPVPAPATEVAPVPEPRQPVEPEPVKKAELTPEPVRQPEPKPEPVKQPEPKPQPAKTEPVATPKPAETPDPVAEAITAEATPAAQPAEQQVNLPQNAPAPAARPRPQEKAAAEAQTAKTNDRKASEKPAQESASNQKSDEKQFDANEIAALLDKQKPSGGGAKRSSQQASLGGERTTGGSKLSQSEMDALRGQVQRCWNIPAGAMDGGNLRVSVKFKLDRAGALEGSPEIVSGGGSSGVERAAAEAARRAVSRCAPYNLPADKYDAWADVIVNFDPSEMY
jgi:colicin import membrane protein